MLPNAALLRMLDGREPTEAALFNLILSELTPRDASPFDLPSPVSPAARRAADILSAEGRALSTDVLASRVGLSARSLERRFRRETGMTVGSWGRQARMLQSLRLLAAGQPVKAAAQAAGYRTPSAFVAAFRAAFGKTPGRYFLAP